MGIELIEYRRLAHPIISLEMRGGLFKKESHPDYEALIDRVRSVQGVLTAKDVPSTDVLAELRTVAAAFTMPDVQPEDAETDWWSKRLTRLHRSRAA